MTFLTDGGDVIDVKLDTSTGYKMSHNDKTFAIRYDDSHWGRRETGVEAAGYESVLNASFLHPEHYEEMREIYMKQSDDFEERNIAGYPGFFTTAEGENGAECCYVILLTQNTALSMRSVAPKSIAEDVINCLEITVVR